MPASRSHNFRCDDDLWEAVVERAAERRESVSDVIRRAFLAYIDD